MGELGATPLIGFAGAPFTVASYLVEGGPSKEHAKTKAMMFGAPDVWDALMRKIAGIAAAYLEVQVAAGASRRAALRLLGRRAHARRLPRARDAALARVLERAGSARRPAHPLRGRHRQPADADGRGRRRRGRRRLAHAAGQAIPLVGDRAVQGNLDPTLVFAPTEVMTARAAEVIEAGRAAKGHIFNLGHGVIPATDPDQLARLTEFVSSSGVRVMHGGRVSRMRVSGSARRPGSPALGPGRSAWSSRRCAGRTPRTGRAPGCRHPTRTSAVILRRALIALVQVLAEVGERRGTWSSSGSGAPMAARRWPSRVPSTSR